MWAEWMDGWRDEMLWGLWGDEQEADSCEVSLSSTHTSPCFLLMGGGYLFIMFDRNGSPQREALFLVSGGPSLCPRPQAYRLAAQEGFEPKGWWTSWLVPLLLSPCPCPVPLKISCQTGWGGGHCYLCLLCLQWATYPTSTMYHMLLHTFAPLTYPHENPKDC